MRPKGGLPEVVEDGISGLLEPLGSEERLSDRIVELLGNPDAHAAMSAAARRRAVEKFDEPIGVSAYEEAYSRLLSHG